MHKPLLGLFLLLACSSTASTPTPPADGAAPPADARLDATTTTDVQAPIDAPISCSRPLTSFVDCAPTFAQQQAHPPSGVPKECTNCDMCQSFQGRCQGYDVWYSAWGYGEERFCVYDPGTGALVGATSRSDTPVESCVGLSGGLALEACRTGQPPAACLHDGGTD